MQNKKYNCPVDVTISLIGGKWKAVILWHLIGKTLRFSELGRILPDSTPKMLTQQLRDLENSKLITRTVFPIVPPKVEYTLTELGNSLIPVLRSMCDWGSDYLVQIEQKSPCCGENKKMIL